MADIEIKREHSLGVDGATERLRSIEPKLRDKFGVTLVWEGDRAQVKGKGVSGDVSVDAQSVGLSLKLGLMLKPLKGKIRESIERSVDKALG